MTSLTSLSKVPPGVAYIFGDEVVIRRAIERIVLEVFSGWSYGEILLPAYDYHEMFARGLGAENADRAFCFTDSEGGLLSLRPDLTSLVARTVATRFIGRPRPIRLCYVGEVFRNLQTPGRAPRESWQLGAELIGNDRLEADAEMLFIAIEAMQRLGLTNFKISVGHAGFFNGMAEELNLSEAEANALRELVDSRNTDAVKQWLAGRTSPADAERFSSLFGLAGHQSILKAAREYAFREAVQSALDDLEHVWEIAGVLDQDRFLELDLGDVKSLDYYTGMTFKIYSPGIGAAVGSGGRYDGLLRNFGSDEPAVGFQLNVERLVRLLKQSNLNLVQPGSAPVVLEADSDNLLSAFQEAQKLREEGNRVEIRTARHSVPPV